MTKIEVDVAIIGGGPAGLSAAVSAKQHGAKKVVVLDRNSWLGGILPQCIHDGFGVEELGESFTGPEYAEKYIQLAEKLDVEIMINTMVLSFNKKSEIFAVNKKGLHIFQANSIILAMGCREKTRWHVLIPGERPSGIYTAGVAQGLINLYNILPGRNILVLGSGDVGLIIARRLKFEGANVLGVVEILPYASGLPRNVVQCLDDYDIPLFLNHTVTHIKGRDRLESVTIAKVDRNMTPISCSEREIKCDTILLSLGLIPENELSREVGIKIDEITGGPIVDQKFMTSVDGVFACGNCLQVYDTVDMLTVDAKKAGNFAVKYVKEMKLKQKDVKVIPGKGVRYVVPQVINYSGIVDFSLRSEKQFASSSLCIKSDELEIFRKKLRFANPANMINVKVEISSNLVKTSEVLEVSIDEN
jgi:NADPH-dependent 2,4-dienoyl-CoA reductase/sulfur reductase-like enzyme